MNHSSIDLKYRNALFNFEIDPVNFILKMVFEYKCNSKERFIKYLYSTLNKNVLNGIAELYVKPVFSFLKNLYCGCTN
jgi:hypothetical protein